MSVVRRPILIRAFAALVHLIVAFGLFAPALAQQPQHVPHVGMLNYAGPNDIRAKQFSDALQAFGYREGSNLKLTHKWADGKMEELPVLAAQLVADKVDVIIALGPAVWAARNATTTIPIVIAFSGDPVGQNVVESLGQAWRKHYWLLVYVDGSCRKAARAAQPIFLQGETCCGLVQRAGAGYSAGVEANGWRQPGAWRHSS